MQTAKQVHVRLLSSFSLVAASGEQIALRGSKAQGLLAYLALQPLHAGSRQKLMSVLWSDRGQPQAQASLRMCLSEIRSAFRRAKCDVLTTVADDVVLDREALAVDALELMRSATEPGAKPGDIPAWSGELLTNLDGIDPQYDEWLFFERTSLRGRYCSGIEARMRDALAQKNWELAAVLAQLILNVDPTSEVAHRSRIVHYANRGDVGAALRQYEVLCQTLTRAMDAAPSQETEELIRRLRAGKYEQQSAEPSGAPDGGSPSARAGSDTSTSGPSIAVLPFANMSGDAGHDYLVDGIADNIITNLSRFRDLAVIAGRSTFAYKGKSTKVQDISRELGARYVLAGSLQRSGDRVRIAAQLIDGATGQHLWTGRYDRSTEDIFAVQDEVTETIVGTLATGFGGRLRKAWRGRIEGASHRNLKACDHFLRGIEHSDRFTKEDNVRAREHCAKAVELDPRYGKAIAKIAWLHLFDVLFGWSDNPSESWARAFEFAALAIERDDDEAWGHCVLGACHFYQGQQERGILGYRRAIELNPNDADVLADFGTCLSYIGQPDEAIDLILKAMRLNPHYPEWYMETLGQAYFDARRYKEAIASYESLRTVSHVYVHLYLAASHAALGHGPEAKKSREKILALDPNATVAKWANPAESYYKNPKDLQHLSDWLRKSGLPD